MKYKYTLFAISVFLLTVSCSPYKDLGTNAEWNYQDFRNQQAFFNSEDGQMAYIDKGQGDVIVLLHGVPTSSWLSREMIDGLVAEGYRVIAPDMLGFGNSESPKGYELYSNENHASRLLALMDSLNIETWTQVVHDAGGAWTWELYKKEPNRIDNLVILNTILFDEGFNPPIRLKKGFFAKTGMWLYRNGLTTNLMLNRFMKKALKDRKELSKAEYEGYRTPIREGKTKGMYYFFTNIGKPFPEYAETLNKLDMPKLVVWGTKDDMLELTPQQSRIDNELGVSSENLNPIDAKHFLQEEQPEEINKLILAFLQNN